MSDLRGFIGMFVAWMLLLFAPSCVKLQRAVEKDARTRVGAGEGTRDVTLLQGKVFDNADATLTGGLIGGLSDGTLGRALESQDEEYASTARDHDYRPAEGTVVRIEDVATDPCRVTSRQTVHLISHYALLAPYRNKTTVVREQWKITHKGQVVGTSALTVARTAGTWSSALPLTLPANAETGAYQASVQIEAAGAKDRGMTTFTVS
jgi:hypothetical protein